MACKVFIDANSVLDYTLKRNHYLISKKIIELAINGVVQLFITPSVLHITAHYLLTKFYGKTKAKEFTLSLLDSITVIDYSHSIAQNALYSTMEDIEDALQYFTALHHKMDYFLIRDQEFLRQPFAALPVLTPEHVVQNIYNK